MKLLFQVQTVLPIAVSINHIVLEVGTDLPTGSWPYQDVVYDPNNQLWACCFNPIENIVDCMDPGNETFEAPAPSSLVVFKGATASATVAAVIPSSFSTSSSPTTTKSTESPASVQPISSSSHPDASSNSIRSDSCKCPSQQGIDIGFGIGIGALGSVIITGAIAYRFRHWRVNRRANWRVNRRADWGDDNLWRGNDPGGGNGPSGGNDHGTRKVTETYLINGRRYVYRPTTVERHNQTRSYEELSRARMRRRRAEMRRPGPEIIRTTPASPMNRRERTDRPTRVERHNQSSSEEELPGAEMRARGVEIIRTAPASPIHRRERIDRPTRVERHN